MTLTITVPEKSRAAAAAEVARLVAYHHPDARVHRAMAMTVHFMVALGMEHQAAKDLAIRICKDYHHRYHK